MSARVEKAGQCAGRLDPAALPPALTVPQAAALLSVSRAALYAAASRGEVPSIRVGRSVRIARTVVLGMLGEPT